MNSPDSNSPKAIISVIYAAVAGPCSFILQPGLVQGLVELRGYTEEQAALVISAENAGLACGTIFAALLINTVSWVGAVRNLVILAAVASFAGLLASDPVAFGAVRFVSAVGSGGLIALTFSMMGLTVKDQRNFSFIIVAVLAYGALGLLVLPTAFAAIGFEGILVFFGLFYLSVLFLLPNMAGYQVRPAEDSGAVAYKFSLPLRLLTLGGVLLYNIAIGMVWVYLFLVGLESGMAGQQVANALTVSQFLGIAGALLASALAYRLGQSIPLLVGIWGGAAGIFMLLGDVSLVFYWFGVCLFNLLWNLTVPYMLALLAKFDDTGQFVSQGVSMQFIGYAVGPYIASQLFTEGAAHPFDVVNLVAVVIFAVSVLLLLPVSMKKDSAPQKV